MLRLIKKFLLLIAVGATLYGCSAQLPDIYFPGPPDPPRIKYTTSYKGGGDFQKTSGFTQILVGGESGAGLIKKPLSVHVSDKGQIFVTDTASFDVLVLDPVAKDSYTLNSKLGKVVYNKPIGVATDSKTGNIFVTDGVSEKVTVIDKNYQSSTLTPKTPFGRPTGLAADSANRKLYITDTRNHNIQVYDLDTLKHLNTIGSRGKDDGQFNFPSHISVDNKGYLYVSDTMNGRIQIFDNDGKFIRTFGQFGDIPGMFARPKGVAVDSEGHIYVVDGTFNNVQIFDQDGNVLLAFSGYGSDRGQMILPAGIYIDKDDYIYVADSWNRRIDVFEFLGEKHKARESGTNNKK